VEDVSKSGKGKNDIFENTEETKSVKEEIESEKRKRKNSNLKEIKFRKQKSRRNASE